ncbi:MAG: DegT/DnrJ/EryC1/StrS family aminotransferase [Bacteroidota bacterium]|uniref:DegT/DnrJ/EryC1/StrS family aminotransferase n=1 Tax=Roseivirga sp. UBA838 TaxID=1947393 RepID=UPI00257FD2AD|nr:DegT/DnrJ/EryC1/StrS family aminotransferase [Roseivirga sp. UBA838]MEC7754781.1 DegT/DnrJ/EryC1/StrS family aminotransferase [Bacteroidota bacterium]|tara:strand:- start:22028 stop:23170 length:1143 start_codon:yes stop_codon:yes gene_type:complete
MEKSKIWLSSPHMAGNEQKYVASAFESNWIAPLGPLVDKFEEVLSGYVGVAHCAALSSGTAAIHLALEILGVGPGDDVIVQSFTFCGSINPVLYQKANPVLVDSDPETWNMDPELLREVILHRIKTTGKRPKAVIPVHLYGMPARIDEIVEVCREFEIAVIEDAAEALGSSYKGQKLGSFGDFGILSFNGNKIITTSGGGALLSPNKDRIIKARFLSTQARDQAVHYQHSELGYNYRLSNVLAGIGVGQMELLEQFVALRRKNFNFYCQLFDGSPVTVHKESSDQSFSNHWLTTVVFPKDHEKLNKEVFMQAFLEENIESRPLWKPMHMQPLYKGAEMHGGAVCHDLFQRGLCLPSGSNLTNADRDRIASVVRKVLRNAQ